jgi:two-component system, chemotaxis family, response regulator Rcp1
MPIDILLVEDSPGDVRLTREALHTANPEINLHVASDGAEALAFLMQFGTHVDEPRPDLVLLDLNLPRMDGRELLATIKSNRRLKTIPTIILTTSTSEEDILKCYQLQANCYFNKPVELDEFLKVVNCINDFWLKKAKLPQKQLDS